MHSLASSPTSASKASTGSTDRYWSAIWPTCALTPSVPNAAGPISGCSTCSSPPSGETDFFADAVFFAEDYPNATNGCLGRWQNRSWPSSRTPTPRPIPRSCPPVDHDHLDALRPCCSRPFGERYPGFACAADALDQSRFGHSDTNYCVGNGKAAGTQRFWLCSMDKIDYPSFFRSLEMCPRPPVRRPSRLGMPTRPRSIRSRIGSPASWMTGRPANLRRTP